MNIQSEIKTFVLDELLAGARPDLGLDEPLFSSGTLDSLGTLRLIAFLEERYGITISDGDVGESNFGSLKLLSEFVEKKRQAA
ncbi:MAG: acyl carrier protein [Limisphaerales bacterium]